MKITIFTPTYNRAYILTRTYESIKKQNYLDLEWVIMDDGSTDNTSDLVALWIKEGIVNIKYHWQKNHGRYAAFNCAKKYFEGELVAFLDSDDFFVKGAIQELTRAWQSIADKERYSGIIAYIETTEGRLVGTEFPKKLTAERIYTLYDRYRMQGDKFLAFRNDLIQKYEYPVFAGEKFTGDSILFNAINDDMPMYLVRQKIIFREYLGDGLTRNLLSHHMGSPNGMREHYKDALAHEKYNQINILKHCIGFVAFSKLTGRTFRDILKETPKTWRTLIMYVMGTLYEKKIKNYC